MQKWCTENAELPDFTVLIYTFSELNRIINVSVDCTLEVLYPRDVWDVRV